MTTVPIRIRTFKDLLVWQKAMDLSVEVYRLTDAASALHAEVERMLDSLVRSLKVKISAKP